MSKQRLLKGALSHSTRPTSAKVRQALFNIWQGKLDGKSWLDICSGTGAIGADALLAGASHVVGIELNRQACLLIQKSWSRLPISEQRFQVIQGDVLRKLKTLESQKFDFIFFDPPYQSCLYDGVLEKIASLQLLSSQGELVVEHNPKFWRADKIYQGLEIKRHKHYGDTTLSFFTNSSCN